MRHFKQIAFRLIKAGRSLWLFIYFKFTIYKISFAKAMIYRWRQRDMWKSRFSQKYQHFLSIEKQPHYPDDTSHLFWLIWKVQKLEVWTAQKTSALVTLALAPFTNSNALKSPQNKFSFCQVDVEWEHAFEISPTFHF